MLWEVQANRQPLVRTLGRAGCSPRGTPIVTVTPPSLSVSRRPRQIQAAVELVQKKKK